MSKAVQIEGDTLVIKDERLARVAHSKMLSFPVFLVVLVRLGSAENEDAMAAADACTIPDVLDPTKVGYCTVRGVL